MSRANVMGIHKIWFCVLCLILYLHKIFWFRENHCDDDNDDNSNNNRISQWYSPELRAGMSGVRVPAGTGIFLFTTVSRSDLGLTQLPIQWVPGALFLGVKRPGRGHSPPSSAGLKNVWSYTTTPQYAFMAWCSVKPQGPHYLHFFKLFFTASC
jgi:hypothetical protein